jgi:membrane dipeptidase
MKVIDLHCDTILKIMESGHKQKLYKNEFCVDIEKLNSGDFLSQFFALFIDLKVTEDPYKYCMKMLDVFKDQIEFNKQSIIHARSYKDIEEAEYQRKIAAILTIEEGGALKGSLDNLKVFYDEGVRLITLTWNYANEIGYPNYKWQYSDKGLTSFGKILIEEMNRLGIIIDVSHMSDKGFYDVAKLARKPFVASHSNARAITNHSRNLTDDMIRILAEKGGVMGINFCSAFLGEGEISTIESMVKHIKHIYHIGGIEVIGIGSDFDGIENIVEIKDSSEMQKLASALNNAGFSEDNIEKIFYKNSLRLLKDTI